MNRLLKGFIFSSGMIASVNAYSQDVVTWDADRAVMAGNGCEKDVTSSISSTGSDLNLFFSNFGVHLHDGFEDGPFSARVVCSLRVPVTIAPGYYISRINQKIDATVDRSSNTRGSVASNLQFFGFNLNPLTMNIPNRSDYSVMRDSRSDYFSPISPLGKYMCSGRETRGLMQLNIAMSGQRNNAHEFLHIQIDGEYNIRLGDDFVVLPCTR